MDLHQLYVFTKVVEHKSFSKAANAIYLSQSTVSSHIQSLEKMLNVQLFDRIGRDIVLTPYGKRLYYWAEKMLVLKDEALLDINKSVTELKGDILIGASSVPAQFIVPKIVKKFRDTYANVSFSLSQYSSKIVAEKVFNGTIDIGILGEKYEHDRVSYIPLVKEKLVLVSSTAYPFTGPVSIQEMINYPFIMRDSDSGTKALMDRFLKKQNIKLDHFNIAVHTDSIQSLIEFIKQGIGISIISEVAAKEYVNHASLQIYEIENFDVDRYFYLAYNDKKTLSIISKLFIEIATGEKLIVEDVEENN